MELTTFQPWERRNAQDVIIRPGTYGKNAALVNGQNTGILDYIGNNLDVLYEMASGPAALTWQSVTDYTADTMIFVGKGLVAVCAQAGRSGTTAPEWQEGEVEDGTVLWQVTNFVEALGDIYTHISTTAIHVNSALKEKWNNHVDDDDIHVTEEEKNAWNGHVEDTDNPHEVTKEQVGLGDVDNTSDLDKPISDAAQSALDGKLTISQGTSNAGKALIVGNDGGVKPAATATYIKRNTVYAVGARVYSEKLGAGEFLVCTQAGTTGNIEPDWGGVTNITDDGTAKFIRISVARNDKLSTPSSTIIDIGLGGFTENSETRQTKNYTAPCDGYVSFTCTAGSGSAKSQMRVFVTNPSIGIGATCGNMKVTGLDNATVHIAIPISTGQICVIGCKNISFGWANLLFIPAKSEQ